MNLGFLPGGKAGIVVHPCRRIFRAGGFVIGKQLHPFQPGSALKQRRCPAHVFLGVVHGGDQRNPNPEGDAAFLQPVQIPQNRPIVHPRPPAVQRRIRQLDIHDDQIHGFRYPLKNLRLGIAAGFDGGMGFRQKGAYRQHEIRLHQYFPAGEGHASPIELQNRQTGPNLFRHRLRRHCPSAQPPRADRANADACAAARAALRRGADLSAGSAMDAHLGNHDLRRGGKPLGIMAPAAAQRAALEKDGRADAGAVIDRHLLDVKYSSGGHPAPQPLTWRTSNSRRSL